MVVSVDLVTRPVGSFLPAQRNASTKETPLSDDVIGEVEKDVSKEESDVYKTGKQTGRRQSNAHHIGYRVLERLSGKPIDIETKNVFAVVQIGSHQFKVSPGDAIYVEKLKFADVNEKVALEKVMLLGSKWQTIIGRPVIPDAQVLAAVEEQALDAKVIIFKKKRRKNYRRHAGHRQELTRLRILDVLGIAENTGTETETETVAKEPLAAVV